MTKVHRFHYEGFPEIDVRVLERIVKAAFVGGHFHALKCGHSFADRSYSQILFSHAFAVISERFNTDIEKGALFAVRFLALLEQCGRPEEAMQNEISMGSDGIPSLSRRLLGAAAKAPLDSSSKFSDEHFLRILIQAGEDYWDRRQF